MIMPLQRQEVNYSVIHLHLTTLNYARSLHGPHYKASKACLLHTGHPARPGESPLAVPLQDGVAVLSALAGGEGG